MELIGEDVKLIGEDAGQVPGGVVKNAEGSWPCRCGTGWRGCG